MKAKHIFPLSALLFFACDKDESPVNTNGEKPIVSVNEINTIDDFSWSASFQSTIEVGFTNPHNLSVDEELIYLLDKNDNTVAKTTVKNGKASFNIQVPSNSEYSLYLPFTGHQQALLKQKEQNFDLSLSTVNKMGKQSNINGGVCTVCETPMTNGLAELPVITLGRQTITSASNVPGWETSASDNQIEVWSTGFNGVPAQEGNQFLEINANRTAALYQELCLEPGSTIRWSVWHRGRAGVDVAKVKIGSSLANATEQATMSDGKNAWGYYTGTYVVPTNQATTLFIFEAISTASGNSSIGNFLDNFRISCDADGDGVVDADDDYPNDPSRAYRSFFPSAGKQIVAFEDLWPSKGDYDFNDLILSNQVEISHNADNELVDAKFRVSIDAIGAGLANGIGMMLLDDNKASIAANSIQSISGDLSLDPNNPAGLILSNDVFATLSNYYQNNGFGPSQTPDTLRFTVNFNASAGSELLPELYLFRTSDRSLEVHRPGFPGTASFDASRFNTSDDNGDFKVADGLPWGIEIITSNSFNHPLEKIDIVEAFPQFANWASSGGAQNSTWYLAPESGKVFN